MEGVIYQFRCAICLDQYDTEEKAHDCFLYGRPTQQIPTGTILGLHNDNMVFVVAKFNVWSEHSHNASYLLYGFRDTPAGDSTSDKEFCGDDFTAVHHTLLAKDSRYSSLKELQRQAKYYAADTKIPAYARAVAFCKKKGIGGQYWNGSALVPTK